MKRKIEEQMKKINHDFEQDLLSKTGHLKYFTTLPKKAVAPQEILKIVDDILRLG